MKEYRQKLEAGEQAKLVHTDIRQKNIMIRQHNEILRIRSELVALEARMLKLIAPIDLRIIEAVITIARMLERLRAEIILSRYQATETKEILWDTKQKLMDYTDYLGRMDKPDLPGLLQQRADLTVQLEQAQGPFKARLRKELSSQIGSLGNRISLARENQRVTEDVQERIKSLREKSELLQDTVCNREETLSRKIEEYHALVLKAQQEDPEKIMEERAQIRPELEKEICEKGDTDRFQKLAAKFDEEMGEDSSTENVHKLSLHSHDMSI